MLRRIPAQLFLANCERYRVPRSAISLPKFVPFRSFNWTFASSQFQRAPSSQADPLYQQIKSIYLNPPTTHAAKLNAVLSQFENANIGSIMDPRYQLLMAQIKQDPTLPNDTIFELNQVLELYTQNKQHGDDYKFEMADNNPGRNSVKKPVRIFGKELTRQQVIGAYFGSMSALLALVTAVGVQNLSLVQLGALTGVVIWVSVTFNPF